MSDNQNEIVRSREELSVKGDCLFFCDCALWQHRIYLYVGRNLEMGVHLRKLKEAPEKATRLSEEEIDFAIDWLDRHGELTTAGDCFGMDGVVFMRLNEFLIGRVDDMAVLMHECLHAANGILCEIGVQGDDNREVLAYTQEFIFKDLMVKVMKQLGLSPIKVE